MEKDWRLVNQEKYLKNRHLTKTIFRTRGNCDHAHCAFCWDKFGAEEGWLHTGYLADNGHHWICEQCFSDFKEMFEWTVS